MQNLCKCCQVNQNRDSAGIIKFPFEKYRTKREIKMDILKEKERDPNYVLYRNEKWNSNILHELMYYIFDKHQPYINFRKQYFMGLCAISELPEFQGLLNDTNCNDEKPIETFIYRARKDHRYYKDIIKVMYHLTDTDVPVKIIHLMDIPQEAKDLTKKYHEEQESLQEYLCAVYSQYINECDSCKKPVYIFNDYPVIIKNLKDEDKDDVKDSFLKIIHLREQTMKIYKDLEIRHAFFLKKYYIDNLRLF